MIDGDQVLGLVACGLISWPLTNVVTSTLSNALGHTTAYYLTEPLLWPVLFVFFAVGIWLWIPEWIGGGGSFDRV